MAGGDTEIGGNGSVWWRVRHFTGAPTDPVTGKKPARKQKMINPLTKPLPDVDEVKIDDEVSGHDSTEVTADLTFTIRLRYEKDGAAQAALKAATISQGPGGYYLEIKVPVIDRANPNTNAPFEVKVEW